MTDRQTDDNRSLDEIPAAPAALQACRECPWRASNLDALDAKRNDPTFSRENLTGHWKSLTTDGATCPCHLATPGYYHHDDTAAEAGLKAPRMFKGEGHRQCAGQLAMVRNELRKLVTYPSHAAYLEANPTGLTEAVATRYGKLLKDPSSVDGFRWPAEDVDDVMDPADLVDIPSLGWKMTRHELADFQLVMQAVMPSLAACDCRFCSQHEQIHAAVPVELADGSVMQIDKAVAGVVREFAAFGVMTLASCEDFGPPLKEMDLNAFLTLRDTPSGHVRTTPRRSVRAVHSFGSFRTTPEARR